MFAAVRKRVMESPTVVRVLPILLVVAASLLVATASVAHHEKTSPYDEYVYADYLYKVPSQGFVRQGEETGEAARELITCREVYRFKPYGGRCDDGGTAVDSAYPYDGGTGADIYTPLYFWATWALSAPLSGLLGIDLFDAGRLVGGLWLAAGAAALYALLQRLGTSRTLATGLTLVVVASPAVFWANTFVSTDAPALLAGSVAGLIGVGAVSRRWSPWWLVPASVVAVLLKFQQILPFTVVAIWLIVDSWTRHQGAVGRRIVDTARDRNVMAGVVAVGAAVVAQAVWVVIRGRLSVGTAEIGGVTGVGRGWGDFIGESTRFLADAIGSQYPLGGIRDMLGILSGWVCVLGVLGVVVVGSRLVDSWRDPIAGDARLRAFAARPFALSVAVGAVCAGPALAISTYLAVGADTPLPTRYGLGLVPLFLGCVALFLGRRRRWSLAIAVFGLCCVVAAVVLVPPV